MAWPVLMECFRQCLTRSMQVIVGVVLALLRGVYDPEFFSVPRKELKGWTLGELLIACSLFGVALTVLKQL